MTIVHMFAGQGVQRPGMGKDLFGRFPELTEQADSVLGYSVADLCLAGGGGRLDDTRYTQPAVYVVNALSHRAAVERDGPPDLALGHSLGEYNALEAAGVFGFAEGLELVAARAAGMARITGGGMSVVLGLGETTLRYLLHRSGFDSVHLANVNAPDQLVLAGPREDLEMMELILQDAGARLARRLPVSGPFHSPHMTPAARELAALLDRVPFRTPQFPVMSNRTARPHRYEELAATLAEQVDHPVRWAESVAWVLDHEPGGGRREGPPPSFVEVGDGTVLTGMVRRIREERDRHSADRGDRVPAGAAGGRA